MENTLKIQFEKGNILSYLRQKAENHNYLKIYGSKKKIKGIVDLRSLLLSNGSGWNDKNEIQRLQDNNTQMFACCFSFSKSENIAMWMLYAREKEDLMINFRPKVIREIQNEKPEIKIGKMEDDGFKMNKKITKDHYDIELIDILYCDSISDRSAIKRSDERAEGVNRRFFEQLTYCRKSYPWNYENECRLLIKINKSILDDNDTHILLPLNSLSEDKYEIYRNPTFEASESEYKRSTLSDEINWDFCRGCSKKI